MEDLAVFKSLLKQSEFEILEKFVKEKEVKRSFSKYIESIPKDEYNSESEIYLKVYTVEIDIKKKIVKGVEVDFIDPYKESSCDFLYESFSHKIQFLAKYHWKDYINFHTLSKDDPFTYETAMEELDKWHFDFTEDNLKKALERNPDAESIQLCLGFIVREFELSVQSPDILEGLEEDELSILNDHAYEILEDWVIRIVEPSLPEFFEIESITLRGELNNVVKQLMNFPSFIKKFQKIKHLALKEIVPLNIEDTTQNDLEKLESLELKAIYFKTIPIKTIQKLTNIRKLVFSETRRSGSTLNSIPERLLDNLLNLEYLDISGNKIKTLPEGFFRNNKKLKILIFTRNEMEEEELLSHLGELPALEKYIMKKEK